jgi:hypothetical protein
VNLLRFLIFARHLVTLFQPIHGSNQSPLRKHHLPGTFTNRFHLRLRLLIYRSRCRHARVARSAHRRLTGPSLPVASSCHGFGEALSLLHAGPPTLRRREQEESLNRTIPDFLCARPTDARRARLFRVASSCNGVACRSRERIATASLRLWQLGSCYNLRGPRRKKGFLSVGHSPNLVPWTFVTPTDTL